MSLTGEDIRKIRTAFGWSLDRFATVLSVHPVTLNRWELAGPKAPPIEGMAYPVLLGLQRRVLQAEEGQRAARAKAKETAAEIDQILVIGGVLLALGALIAFANNGKR